MLANELENQVSIRARKYIEEAKNRLGIKRSGIQTCLMDTRRNDELRDSKR